MCRQCSPGDPGNRPDEVEAAVAAAARVHLSRRALLRAGLGALALPATQFLHACATVPVTGRSQLRLVSETDEAQVGVQAFQQLRQDEEKKGRYLTEQQAPKDYAWVKRVANRVIWASGLANAYQWQFMIINEPNTINAAAIAGGRIIVYTGILPVARDDGGLATILGHETAHVMAHHTAERISQNEVVSELGKVAGAAGSGWALAAVGLGQLGFLLPYSRAQESEADHIGLLLMAKAGYDPRQSVALWQRMEQTTGSSGRLADFLSTHPNPGTRITDLESWLPQAWPYYQNPNLPLPNAQ